MTRINDENLVAFDVDPLTRSLNLERHCFGDFSMANVQANEVMEDQSQVEVAAHNALYLGVYDGHGGVEASLYILSNLFKNLLRFALANQNQNANAITAANLRDAVADTENGFLEYVNANYHRMRMIGKTGSCCLAAVVWKGTLHVANLGDSRAVIGYMDDNNRYRAEQLTRDHNCNDELIRAELWAQHPDDPTIVMERNGGWRVKGLLMVSRSIGDTYLKRPEFSLHESFPKYEDVPEPFTRGVVSAEPEMHSRVLTSKDKFIIFASDGLWELLTNERAVHIVHTYSRNGIAKRLLFTALHEAARRGGITYGQMQNMFPGRENRRVIHDDISVIVVFLDNTSIFRKRVADISYTGSSNLRRPSDFGQSGFNASPFRSLKASIKQRFKSSSSQNQSSTGETSQGLRVLGQSSTGETSQGLHVLGQSSTRETSHTSQNPNTRSRWKTLKQKFSSSSSSSRH